uniref:E3 ubiquitin-protein ligase RNF220 n=1 Tax=Oryzias latipes TaxID=8090 RepID=A0A3P9JP65_ORYLA
RTTSKEFRDSDVDLDVDGDDTLEYGKVQYPLQEKHKQEKRRKQNMVSFNVCLTHTACFSLPVCASVCVSRPSEDSTLTTLDALKARIRDLEKQLSKGDRFKCLICMDTYTTPLTSIQCWHVHCEECWLRTLGAKKLCPQCNTITSPGDLRRVFL